MNLTALVWAIGLYNAETNRNTKIVTLCEVTGEKKDVLVRILHALEHHCAENFTTNITSTFKDYSPKISDWPEISTDLSSVLPPELDEEKIRYSIAVIEVPNAFNVAKAKVIEQYYPTILSMFKDKLGPAFVAAAKDDNRVLRYAEQLYPSLPLPARWVISSEEFNSFILKNRTSLINYIQGEDNNECA